MFRAIRPRRFFRSVPARIGASLLLILALLGGVLSPLAQVSQASAAAQDITLQNGAVIHDTSSGRISVIWDGSAHWLNSPAAFSASGLSGAPIQNLNAAEIREIPAGNAVAVNTISGNIPWPLAMLRSDPVFLDLGVPAATAGQSIPVHGSGFIADETVTISGPGNVAFTVSANGSGAFQVNMPITSDVSIGEHQLYAQGRQSGLFGMQAFYVIAAAAAPSLSVAPAPLISGANFNLTGNGFQPGERVWIVLATGAVANEAGSAGNGAFGPVMLPVPSSLSLGAHTLWVFGLSSHRFAEQNVTVAGAPHIDVATATPIPVVPLATPTAIPTTIPVVLAAPRVFVNPGSVSPGAQALVSGSGFAPGELVLIRLNGVLMGGASADAAGNFSGFIVTVPSGMGTGVYGIGATGAVSGRSAGAGLTVVAPQAVVHASLAISPQVAIPGARISVAGTGFLANETILIRFNNGMVQDVRADAGGSFVNGTFFLPTNLNPGQYPVTAGGGTSGRSAGAVLTVVAAPRVVVPQVFVSSASVTPGSRITLSGRGFGAHETILVRIDGALVLTANTDASGSFSLSFNASSKLGGHTILATGAGTARAAAVGFQIVRPVTPAVGLNSGTVHRGSKVLVSGSHFVAGEIVLIKFRGVLVQAAVADRNGHFANAAFTIPSNTPYGSQEVQLLGSRSGRSAKLHLQVTVIKVAAHISSSMTTVHRGNVLLLHGTGFSGKETILISYRGKLVQATVADSHGNFSNFRFTIPSNSPYGTASILVTGAASRRSATVKVKVVQVPGLGISVGPLAASAGAVMSVSGHGFSAGEPVLLYLRGRLVGIPIADRNGNFSRSRLTIPRGIQTGVTTVEAIGSRSHRHISVTVVIL